MAKPKDLVEEVIAGTVDLTDRLLELDSDARVKLLREVVSRLRGKLENREGGFDILRAVFEEIYSAEPLIGLPGSPRPSQKKAKEDALLHLTDIHFGKETLTYSLATAGERLYEVSRAALEIANLRRATAGINRLVIALGGDMVEGEGVIFPGQAHEIDSDLMSQMVKDGPEIMANALVPLVVDFPEVCILGVPGNHGRQAKGSAKNNNNDSVFYHILKQIMGRILPPKHYSRIQWDLPLDRPRGKEWFAHTTVCDRWGVLLVHGDQVRGQLGFPWYGVGKKAAGWAGADMPPWDYLLMGHFHTAAAFDLNRRTVLATGSIETDNSYALENLAAAGTPMQRLAFFNHTRGLLADHRLYVEEREPNR